uniref:IgGFc-binding protein N-terminal domain-containing protein n=1 Tax=Amphimedon queenslandica TaxID=400682 RepID=A0A1X7TYY9_AMPQE
MSSYLLLVILVCFMSNGILLEANGESCTEGFIDYSLLEDKAKTPTGNLRNNRLSNYKNPMENVATRWIIIEDNIKFTCAAVITEILIGVDIRTVNDNVGKNLYPKFEVWAPTNDDDVYTREISIEIRLTPDDFTTNGQYRFTLPTPLNVSSGYRIGVYQPPGDRSVVRFHYVDLDGNGPSSIDHHRTGKVQSDYINNSNIKILGGGRLQVNREEITILILPVVQDTGCFAQFVPDDIVNSLSYSITESYYVSDTRIFPDIRFTCHGIITNWIVVAPALVMPVIKIRHSNNLTTTAATLNTSASNAVRITSLLYNFTMSNEIAVQAGDILMIESNATNYMYYQQYNGPHNYRLGDNNELIALDTNDYPLISVVVEPIHVSSSTVTNTKMVSSTSTHITATAVTPINSNLASLTISTGHSTIKSASSSYLSHKTDLPTESKESNTFVYSTSLIPAPTLQLTSGNIPTTLVAVLSTVFILLVVTILVILIVSVLVCRRRSKNGIGSSAANDLITDTETSNTLQKDIPTIPQDYEEARPIAEWHKSILSDINLSTNPSYGITRGSENISSQSGIDNPSYEFNTTRNESK